MIIIVLSFSLFYLVILIRNNSKYGQRIIKWTKEAEQAFEILKHRAETSKLLFHAKRHDQYLVQQDSCDHAGRNILYQQQIDKNGNQTWVIINLWSKIFPELLIKQHISIKEG